MGFKFAKLALQRTYFAHQTCSLKSFDSGKSDLGVEKGSEVGMEQTGRWSGFKTQILHKLSKEEVVKNFIKSSYCFVCLTQSVQQNNEGYYNTNNSFFQCLNNQSFLCSCFVYFTQQLNRLDLKSGFQMCLPHQFTTAPIFPLYIWNSYSLKYNMFYFFHLLTISKNNLKP